MKNFITPSLLKFSLAAAVLAIIVRYFLSSHSIAVVVGAGVLYFMAMFAVGWYFGEKDVNYLPICDVGFRFHFTTYVVHNLISELWFALNFNSAHEKIWAVHWTAIIWGAFLLTHFLLFLWARKKSFNGLDKKELFE